MILCSIIVEQKTKTPFIFSPEDAERFELVYTGEALDNLKTEEIRILQNSYSKFVPYCGEETWFEILKQCSGKYVMWLFPNELWSRHFLNEVTLQLNQLISNKKCNKIIPCGFGYVRKENHTVIFSCDYNPNLRKKNSLSANIARPLFYSPLVKYFFRTDICKEMNLSNYWFLPQWHQRYILTVFSYISTIYEMHGMVEPKYFEFPLDFSVPESSFLDTQSFEEYNILVGEKRVKIGINPWSDIFWAYKLHEARQKILNLFPMKHS